MRIFIHVPSQTLDLLDATGALLRRYACSTSSFGLGTEPGSNKTPTGHFRIAEKHGDSAPAGMIFKSRLATGKFGNEKDDADHVQTRILWLDGLDKANANTKSRYIYIHGTNAESLLGTPASHGCVRMGNGDIIELYEAVPIGTPVEISAAAERKRKRTAPAIVLALLFCALFTGCSVVERVGVKALYRRAPLPEAQIARDLPYVSGSRDPKHRLDLFRPAGKGWPVFIFIHGGSWDSGDKSLTAGGEDIYGNIGRFYAARGIGVAVINYRLLPGVTWREQLRDATHALAWVQKSIAAYGGDPARVFIGGHSAGAQLAANVALRPRSGRPLAGAICISGAGYDMTDAETYRLGNLPAFYAQRFAENGANPDWRRTASPATYATRHAPPFLLLFAESDSAPLRRQSQHFHGLLDARGVENHLIAVPDESHTRIVLALTRPDKLPAAEIVRFIRSKAR